MVHGVFDEVPLEIRVESGKKISQIDFEKSVLIEIGPFLQFIGAVPRSHALQKHAFIFLDYAHIYVPSRMEVKLQRVGGR